MACNYDALYGETSDALGTPTQEFVTFFDTYAGGPSRVLDVGCGQGRDALFIAKLGHSVVGVDVSENGIRDIRRAASTQTLNVHGIVADITDYTPDGMFDVVVIDRTLHMLPAQPRMDVLARLITHTQPNAWVLIADEASNMGGFKQVLSNSGSTWTPHLDKRGYLFVQRD